MTRFASTRLCRTLVLAVCAAAGAAFAKALPSEITVNLRMSYDVFVLGERMRGIVDVANASADPIDCRTNTAPDRLLVELYRASDKHQFEHLSNRPFTAPFALLSGEGQKLETLLGDHFAFEKPTRYFARAVLVHDGTRYESPLRTFDVVPGLKCGGALQMFAHIDGLRREFELLHWGRDRVEHLFLRAKDHGVSEKKWWTSDLGPFLRVTRPRISVLPSGEVVVLHRATQDSFIRSVFWSLPEDLEIHEHEMMLDPDVAGSERVKELYKEGGGVEPVKKAWWKFW